MRHGYADGYRPAWIPGTAARKGRSSSAAGAVLEFGQRGIKGSIANLVVLVVLTVLSIYRPWGETRRGKAQMKE